MRLSSTDESLEHRLGPSAGALGLPWRNLTQCDLLGADCEDFNVMTRRNRCRPG